MSTTALRKIAVSLFEGLSNGSIRFRALTEVYPFPSSTLNVPLLHPSVSRLLPDGAAVGGRAWHPPETIALPRRAKSTAWPLPGTRMHTPAGGRNSTRCACTGRSLRLHGPVFGRNWARSQGATRLVSDRLIVVRPGSAAALRIRTGRSEDLGRGIRFSGKSLFQGRNCTGQRSRGSLNQALGSGAGRWRGSRPDACFLDVSEAGLG